MGSVIDYIECPNCHSEDCYSDFYYKTGEGYESCGECGYSRSVTIKDESRKKKLSEITEDDWVLNELVNPWGAYRIKEIGNIGFTCGSLESKEQYEELLKNVMDNIELVDEFTLSRYVNEKIVKLRVVESAKVINEMVVGD